jgi:hypothetical protein
VQADPEHVFVADGEVKFVTFGLPHTINDAILLDEMPAVQFDEFFIEVIIKVVDPTIPNDDDGIVNVPLPVPITIVAVLFVALFAPVIL